MPTARQQKTSEKLRIFSERFKAALEKSTFHFQDNEIAEKVGVEPSAISSWRQGRNMAKGKNLRRLAEVLKCRPGWLLGEESLEEAGAALPHPSSDGDDRWRHRALVAEKKLADLRSGLRFLLETSGDTPQDRFPGPPLAAPGVPDRLRKAGSGENIQI